MMDTTVFDIELFQPEAAVIGNGEFPRQEILHHWLDRVGFTACCDGAADHFLSLGLVPDLIIGDCDSLSDQVKLQYGQIVCVFADQESNDQTKAVRYLASKGIRNMVILGATGKRDDHTLGNISLLVHYLECGITVVMPTDFGVFIPCRNNMNFRSFVGQQVSIFRFGAKHLQGENLKYPLRDFDMFWQGTLNESTDKSFSIYAEGCYLVYLAY